DWSSDLCSSDLEALVVHLCDEIAHFRSQILGGDLQGSLVIHLPIEAMAAVHLNGNVLVVQGKGLYPNRPIVKTQGGLQSIQIDLFEVQKIQFAVQGGDQGCLFGIHRGVEQFGQQVP